MSYVSCVLRKKKNMGVPPIGTKFRLRLRIKISKMGNIHIIHCHPIIIPWRFEQPNPNKNKKLFFLFIQRGRTCKKLKSILDCCFYQNKKNMLMMILTTVIKLILLIRRYRTKHIKGVHNVKS